MTQSTMRLTVNGKTCDVDAAPDTALLYVLRNDLALNGPKYGCGLGECGACAVLIDGVAARSCVIPIEGCVDRDIVTLEGLGSREHPDPVQQAFIAEQFLPVIKTEKAEGQKQQDFIFEPSKDVLIEELMPKILNTQLYKAVLDANASEHGARMTAMDKATENANELLKSLKISYNRARQAAITTELTEIVSGAAALQG